MFTSHKILLPNPFRNAPCAQLGGCFLAGDTRVNENTALASMHTIWTRLHNFYAEEINRDGSRTAATSKMAGLWQTFLESRNQIYFHPLPQVNWIGIKSCLRKLAKLWLLYYRELFMMNGFRKLLTFPNNAWKVSKYRVFSNPYFPAFALNTEIYSVNLRNQSEYRKIRTRNNSVKSVQTFHLVQYVAYDPSMNASIQ